MPFTQTFGGDALLPSNSTFLQLNMSAGVILQWPLEQQIGGTNVLSDITEVNATNPGLNIDLSDARIVSQGLTALFNNTGAQTVSIRSATGATLVSLVSGTVWMIYLVDNTTEGGTWRVFQFGASVSVAVAAALAGAGLRAIATTLNQDIPISPFNTTPTTVNDIDRARLLNWTGGVGILNLPVAASVGNGWYVQVRNTGSGDLTVVPPSGTIDGLASRAFPAGSSAFIVTDGANYFTLGFGSGSGGGSSGFDFIQINVAGSGDYVLAGAELNKVGYRFTGVLSGNRNIIVPGSTDEYWVDNQTTGAFTLFVKTVAQVPGVQVLQNNRNILYCDGTNVIPAESSTVSFPIPVAQGGTGATTAGNARTNLGATVTGAALFTAVDAAAARTAIAAVSTSRTLTAGFGLTGGGDLSADRSFAVDLTANFTWTGTHNFNGVLNYGGSEVGLRIMPQNLQNSDYALVAADSGKHIYATGTGGTNTWTIPSNASVAYPLGTVLTFVNRSGISKNIAISSDTLILAGSGATGTRALANASMATALKVAATVWMCAGTGVT